MYGRSWRSPPTVPTVWSMPKILAVLEVSARMASSYARPKPTAWPAWKARLRCCQYCLCWKHQSRPASCNMAGVLNGWSMSASSLRGRLCVERITTGTLCSFRKSVTIQLSRPPTMVGVRLNFSIAKTASWMATTSSAWMKILFKAEVGRGHFVLLAICFGQLEICLHLLYLFGVFFIF